MDSRRFIIAAVLSFATTLAAAATDLVIATVDNDLMIEMQRQSRHFESANPDIKLQWVTLPEGILRQRLTADITTKGGQFDVMTIGLYETPIWGRRGWLTPLDPPADYAVDDLAASPAAAIELQALHSANFKAPTRPPSPYSGIQFVAIPEFQAIGNTVGGLIAHALQGRSTVDEALVAAQAATVRAMASKRPGT